MKRVLPAVLAFLGVACITAAIAVPLWLVPQLKVVPLDLDITSDATSVAADGSPGERFPAEIFDRCSVGQAKAQTLQAHLTQQRRSVIVDPSDRRQATIQSAQTVRIDGTRAANGDESQPAAPAANGDLQCNDGLLTANIDRVSLNRKTSVPNGTVSSLQVEAAPEGVNRNDVSVQLPNRKGFQYKFPFNTKKRSYLYYDLNTRQDTPAAFVGEETVHGIKTYHFRTQVPETDLSSLPNPQNEAPLGTMLTMPAKWWGITGPGVRPGDHINMHRYATATREVWVEPRTGTIVNGREVQHQYFRSPYKDDDSTPAPVRNFQLDALKANFAWSDKTVSAQADKADKYMGQLKLGNFWLPLILGIVGAVLLLACLLILLRRRRNRGAGPDGDPRDDGQNEYGDNEYGDNGYGEVPDTDPGADAPTVVDPGGPAAARAAAPTAVIANQRSRHSTPASPNPDHPGHEAGPDDADDDTAYLWDHPTEQIPRVEGPAPTGGGDHDFRPIDESSADPPHHAHERRDEDR
ncbi:DUF3068 domain-containing protein [Gordonia sp. DT219]|uniref:DUF3068 domain-containing protein n=1 Tax=Gordonia sp. DT219 TaxID=3416658 RepID=UPI003CF899D5